MPPKSPKIEVMPPKSPKIEIMPPKSPKIEVMSPKSPKIEIMPPKSPKIEVMSPKSPKIEVMSHESESSVDILTGYFPDRIQRNAVSSNYSNLKTHSNPHFISDAEDIEGKIKQTFKKGKQVQTVLMRSLSRTISQSPTINQKGNRLTFNHTPTAAAVIKSNTVTIGRTTQTHIFGKTNKKGKFTQLHTAYCDRSITPTHKKSYDFNNLSEEDTRAKYNTLIDDIKKIPHYK